VEEADGVGQRVFDEHPLRVSRDQLVERPVSLVGEQDSRFVVTQVVDE
jgi:hypothetical protein